MGKTQEDFDKAEYKDHVFLKPNVYMGSISLMNKEEYIYCEEVSDTGTIHTVRKKNIQFSDGLLRMFIEILSNASDNIKETRGDGGDPGNIYVTMDETTISVRSEGDPIPIEIKQEFDCYVPELIFNEFLSGSNLIKDDKNGKTAGTNGIGASLVNRYSKRFECEIYDGVRGKHYTQRWFDNMDVCEPPIIEDYEGPSSVTITYELDMERFSITHYSEDLFNLYKRCTIDTSFTAQIIVYFNGEEFDYRDPEKYYKLYFPGARNYIVHREEDNVLIAVDTPFAAQKVCFTNCLPNSEGGCHYDGAMEAVARGVINSVNTDKDGNKVKNALDIRDARRHISIIVSVHINKPEFDGQSKLNLKSPLVRFKVPKRLANEILTWGFRSAMEESLKVKKMKKLYCNNKTRRKTLLMDNLIDAKEAGGKNSSECVIIVMEGKSALTYAKHYKGLLSKHDRDRHGTFPLTGKPLNVIRASLDKLEKNSIVNSLNDIIGIEHGVDYSINENYHKLRYGGMMMMADADPDGQHIKALLISFFQRLCPSLLHRGFLTDFRTPYLRVSMKDISIPFLFTSETRQWEEETGDVSKWLYKYFKGLASGEEYMIADDVESGNLINLTFDEFADDNIHLALSSDSDARKEWFLNWDPNHSVEFVQNDEGTIDQDFSNLIHTDIAAFHVYNILRNIPAFDGLKPSQRKILWTSIKRYGYDTYKNYMNTTKFEHLADKSKGMVKNRLYSYKRKQSNIKVAGMAGAVQGATGYHHGEKSLTGAICKMAQRYVGSNNLPYLRNIGMFGSREGSDVPKPRYIYTAPEWWLKYCYSVQDTQSLEILINENEKIEPKILYPIIPMTLVNGAMGIGSGWRTTIPSFNPFDIIDWYLAKIKGEETDVLQPWYHGYQGVSRIIYMEKRKGKKKEEDVTRNVEHGEEREDLEDLEEDVDIIDINNNNLDELDPAILFEGVFERTMNRKGESVLHITELPIGRSTDSYRIVLKKLAAKSVIKKDFDDDANPKTINFTVTLKSELTDDNIMKVFKLRTKIRLTSMSLLDTNNNIVVYREIVDILEDFYNMRYPIYENKKQSILRGMESLLHNNREKIRYLKAVDDGSISIKGDVVKKSVIIEECKSLDLDVKYLNMKVINMVSEEYREKLEVKCGKIEEDISQFSLKDSKEMWYNELLEFRNALDHNYELMFV